MTDPIYILCVDDEQSILGSYNDILTPKQIRSSRMKRKAAQRLESSYTDLRNFFQVSLAASGEEAVELVSQHAKDNKHFAVCFVDMRMPGLDGRETIRQFLEIDPKIQCVVVTADTDHNPDEIVTLFHDPSQFVYLNKPFYHAEISQMALSLASLWIEKKRTEKMLDSMVKAATQAIEARDPTTSGHSERVAKMTVALAKTVDQIATGPYSDIQFDRYQLGTIRYASLLHDVGKIGVSENVLLKAYKLYPKELDIIKLKFDLEEAKGNISGIQKENLWNNIIEANQPALIAEKQSPELQDIFSTGLITDAEYNYLKIPRGTLTFEERLEIENHVQLTYDFLKRIAWTKDYEQVPEIAKAHHEKLDGSGYPDGTTNIPIESRMMAISDIFDALTASDRPYKKATSIERALDIIQFEVDNKKCDPGLFKIFTEAKVYETILS